jgi:putative spermidine/putrescine transport system ATP-binding protein
MNLIEGNVAGGTFTRTGLSLPLPISDGPAILAVRPEVLGLVPARGDGAARIHRITDYGTHAIVDLDLADGKRLKSMVADATTFAEGQAVDLIPGAVAAYRDNAAVYRGSSALLEPDAHARLHRDRWR